MAAIVSDASSLMLDHAVDGAFDGDFGALEAGARRALTKAAMPVSCSARRSGMPSACAAPGSISMLSARRRGRLVGGGPRRAQIFDAHLRAWTAARLARAVEILAEAINKARREPKLADAIALRALWRIASAAKPQRR